MAKCFNKNAAEYIALKEVYSTNIATDNVINSWQSLNNVDTFPTVLEAQEFRQNQKIAFALRQRDFAESLLNNLRRERIAHSYQGSFYVNNSNANTRAYDETVLQSNLKRLQRYLEINNIPQDRVNIERTQKTFRVTVNEDMLSAKDILERSRSWDTPRARGVVMHLKRLFPQVNVQMLSVSKAEELYESMPEWKKKNVPFNKVNSFYVDGTAYLIKGRVTDETAIEEMLHPFIDAIKVDNADLFNNLLAEAKKNFPVMTQEIMDSYNKSRNFSELDQNLEIVTQALSRHFNNEYETQPTQSFLDRVKQALDWFMELLQNFNEYLTGRAIVVGDISANSTFSDLAKLLNTEGIEFKLEKRVNGTIRFSLTPEKQSQVDRVISQSNDIQAAVIKKLFHQAQQSEQEIDSLSANLNDTTAGATIVTLNEEDHTYVDITNGEIYTSVTTAIKGTLKNQEDVQLNIDIGNDVDALLDGIVAGSPLADVMPKMNVINEETAKDVYKTLDSVVKMIAPEGSVVLSQVVLFDEASKMAGTADLIVIDKNGFIKVVDLKTTKNSLLTPTIKDTAFGRKQSKLYDKEWDLSDDSLLKQAGIDKLSTRQQHNLQVNIYRRMLQNMGYKVYQGDYAASTFHMLAGIKGKKKNQKFDGNIKMDDWVNHPPSQNILHVDKLVPLIDYNIEAEKLEQAVENAEDAIYMGNQEVQENEAMADTIDAQTYPEYNTILSALKDYRLGLIEKRKAIDTIKSNIFMDRTKEDVAEGIENSLAMIGIAISEGPIAQSKTYSALLRDALKQVKAFSTYVENPENYGKNEFITYVLNFNRFIATFRGLYSIQDSTELNATQRSLVLNLQLELNKLAGTDNKEGLIDQSIFNYVKEVIRETSNKNFGEEGSQFTMEDLDELMRMTEDISLLDLTTRDMATSPDTMLAIMDKIYKAKKQELLDRVATRENAIRKAGNKIAKLTGTEDFQKMYDFMLNFDDEGNFLGTYVKKIGSQYNQLHFDLRKVLYDNEGKPYIYRDVTDDSASQEDIDYNIDLANKKAALGNFFRAEMKDENGDLVDGEYHFYTQEFKDARNQFEYWVPGEGDFGSWRRKPGIPDSTYGLYEAKYFNFVPYTKAIRVDGQPTGRIIKDQTYRSPKVKYREVREMTASGQDMRSQKYIDLMNPKDALGQAQKEFYELYIQYYEEELLRMLPVGTRSNMLGRVPTVKSHILSNLKAQPSLVTKLFGRMSRSVKNLFETTSTQKSVALDENGNIVSTMPIYYTGRPRTDKDLEDAEAELNALNDQRKKGKITLTKYKTQKALLNGRIERLRNQPTLGEINKDIATSLLKFSAMAEHYETMGTIEDTLNSMVKVLEQREYVSAESSTRVGKFVDGIFKQVGVKRDAGKGDSNTLTRARKWMSMVYYDNEEKTRGWFQNLAEGGIQLSSLSYVAFNPFGNFQNYLIGQVNNNIELLGQRFFSKEAYLRSSFEFKKRALTDVIKRTGHAAQDLADIATLGTLKSLNKSDYDVEKPNSKYEGFVTMYRMMDKLQEQREFGSAYDQPGEETIWRRFTNWGYVMQDAAEYTVQTKVGMAMLMDTMMENSQTGEQLSLYDAFDFDTKTHTLKLKEGFDTVIEKDGRRREYNNKYRYELRNKIREVNKQIHGNYARDDRMYIQAYTLGQLAAQFHKWIAPAVRARYQQEYFDENLGWMEGRYASMADFIRYSYSQVKRGDGFRNLKSGFLEEYGFTGEGTQADQRAMNKLLNVYRTVGEAGIIASITLISIVLDAILVGEDDDSDEMKRLKNFLRYTGDRTLKESLLFTPTPMGVEQQYQFFKSPMPATRTLGELAEAMNLTIQAPFYYGMYIVGERGVEGANKRWAENSKFVYQNNPKAGESKIFKNWSDAMPIFYSIKKYKSYLTNTDFFIK